MAEHENAMDYREHERTFELFMGLVKWGTIGVIVIVALMGVFLV